MISKFGYIARGWQGGFPIPSISRAVSHKRTSQSLHCKKILDETVIKSLPPTANIVPSLKIQAYTDMQIVDNSPKPERAERYTLQLAQRVA